jgi:HEAT repeat protein
MLLYRPLLDAYQQTPLLPVRRYLLRQFAHPRIHAEPDEVLAVVEGTREVSAVSVADRLSTEIALREQTLRLRLTTRDAARQSGGMWTYHSAHRAFAAWSRSEVQAPALAQAAGEWLGPIALQIARTAGRAGRAEALAALGDLGPSVALPPLAQELRSGPMPGAAAVGLARLGREAAVEALLPAVLVRGLPACASWIGVALFGLAAERAVPLLDSVARSDAPEVREQAAWAVGAFPVAAVQPVLERLVAETDSFVRLNLLSSLGRMGVPGGMRALKRLLAPADADLLRTALIECAGWCHEDEARGFLEEVLSTGSPSEKAEALQALVAMGASGAELVAEARKATASQNSRLMLLGLLALAVWAPEEAFAAARKAFDGPPAGAWFIATYVLRYLRGEQTVRLLKRLHEAARGSELEEVVIDALSRHLDQPGVMELFLQVVKSGTRESTARKILQDLARHLPEEQALEAAAAVRGLLSSAARPEAAGPLLVTLGALGGPEDLPLLLAHAGTGAAVEAVQGIELLMADGAIQGLETVARSGAPGARGARGAAIVAQFRLGHLDAVGHLDRLVASGDGGEAAAARCALEMALSVRCAKTVPRLALLYSALQGRADAIEKARGEGRIPDPVIPAGSGPCGPAAPLPAPSAGPLPPPPLPPRCLLVVQDAFTRRAADVIGLPPPSRFDRAPPQGAGGRVYRELGRHLTGAELARARTSRLPFVVTVVLALLAALFWGRWLGDLEDQRLPHLLDYALPTLYRAGAADPARASVEPGALLSGRPDRPVQVMCKVPENSFTVRGAVKVVAVELVEGPRPRFSLELELVSGALSLAVPIGRVRVRVAGTPVVVTCTGGSATAVVLGPTLRLSVATGEARVERGRLLLRTLAPGQAAVVALDAAGGGR